MTHHFRGFYPNPNRPFGRDPRSDRAVAGRRPVSDLFADPRALNPAQFSLDWFSAEHRACSVDKAYNLLHAPILLDPFYHVRIGAPAGCQHGITLKVFIGEAERIQSTPHRVMSFAHLYRQLVELAAAPHDAESLFVEMRRLAELYTAKWDRYDRDWGDGPHGARPIIILGNVGSHTPAVGDQHKAAAESPVQGAYHGHNFIRTGELLHSIESRIAERTVQADAILGRLVSQGGLSKFRIKHPDRARVIGLWHQDSMVEIMLVDTRKLGPEADVESSPAHHLFLLEKLLKMAEDFEKPGGQNIDYIAVPGYEEATARFDVRRTIIGIQEEVARPKEPVYGPVEAQRVANRACALAGPMRQHLAADDTCLVYYSRTFDEQAANGTMTITLSINKYLLDALYRGNFKEITDDISHLAGQYRVAMDTMSDRETLERHFRLLMPSLWNIEARIIDTGVKNSEPDAGHGKPENLLKFIQKNHKA